MHEEDRLLTGFIIHAQPARFKSKRGYAMKTVAPSLFDPDSLNRQLALLGKNTRSITPRL